MPAALSGRGSSEGCRYSAFIPQTGLESLRSMRLEPFPRRLLLLQILQPCARSTRLSSHLQLTRCMWDTTPDGAVWSCSPRCGAGCASGTTVFDLLGLGLDPTTEIPQSLVRCNQNHLLQGASDADPRQLLSIHSVVLNHRLRPCTRRVSQ